MRLLFQEAVVLKVPGNCTLGVGVDSSAEDKRWWGLSAGESTSRQPPTLSCPLVNSWKVNSWKGPLFSDSQITAPLSFSPSLLASISSASSLPYPQPLMHRYFDPKLKNFPGIHYTNNKQGN